MKSAFGIKLQPARNLEGQPMLDGEGVSFWKDEQGWCGSLYVNGFVIRETIGSASPQACYRSMRGQVANLRNALTKALEGHRG